MRLSINNDVLLNCRIVGILNTIEYYRETWWNILIEWVVIAILVYRPIKQLEKKLRKVGNELAEIYMNYCDVWTVAKA